MHNTYKNRTILLIFLATLLSGCAEPIRVDSKQREFIKILGSDYGNYADTSEIIRDIKISDLHIRQVRSKNAPHCANGFSDHVEIDGEINVDSTFVMGKILNAIPKCVSSTSQREFGVNVYMNSGGGLLADGFALGEIFREHYVTTIVTNKQVCASSCAIAFLGGGNRSINGSGKLLFHSPYTLHGIGINCASKQDMSQLSVYLYRMLSNEKQGYGVGKTVFNRAMSYCSSTDGWEINNDAAALYKITTQ